MGLECKSSKQNQKTPRITGKFCIIVQNEARQNLTECCQVNMLILANTPFQWTKRQVYTWISQNGQYKIQLIMLFAAKDGESLYSKLKKSV